MQPLKAQQLQAILQAANIKVNQHKPGFIDHD